MRAFFLFLLSSLWSFPLLSEPFSLKGEFFYFKPEIESDDFFRQVTVISNDERKIKALFIDPKFDPGFRLEAGVPFGCTTRFLGRFTYFNSGKNRRRVEDFRDNTFVSALGSQHFRYYTLDFLFAKNLVNCPTFNFVLEGGIQYANFHVTQKTVKTFNPLPSTGDLEKDFFTRVWGVGPEIVLDLDYHLPWSFCGIFSLAAEGRASLLSGSFKDRTLSRSFSQSQIVTSTQVFDPLWRVIPTFDFKLGLNWAYCSPCFKPVLEVGYEWLFYQDAVIQDHDLSFQGPYLSLNLLF